MTFNDLISAVETARKNRDTAALMILTTLLSEVNAIGKKALRPPTDDEVAAQAKTTLKQYDTLLNGDPTKNIDPLPESDYRIQTQAKRELLNALLPQPLVGEELGRAIRDLADANDVPISPQNIGKIMPLLKAQYGSRVDGASVKAALIAGV